MNTTNGRTRSQRIARNIHAIERHLRMLRDMSTEIIDPAIIIMGPDRIGIDALDSFGAREKLLDTIASYEATHAHLCAKHAEAEIAECVARLWTLHGPERGKHRRYLRDLIERRRDAA